MNKISAIGILHGGLLTNLTTRERSNVRGIYGLSNVATAIGRGVCSLSRHLSISHIPVYLVLRSRLFRVRGNTLILCLLARLRSHIPHVLNLSSHAVRALLIRRNHLGRGHLLRSNNNRNLLLRHRLCLSPSEVQFYPCGTYVRRSRLIRTLSTLRRRYGRLLKFRYAKRPLYE